MVVIFDALSLLALTTATLMCALTWVTVRQRSQTVRLAVMLGLLAVLILPGLFFTWGGKPATKTASPNVTSARVEETTNRLPSPEAKRGRGEQRRTAEAVHPDSLPRADAAAPPPSPVVTPPISSHSTLRSVPKTESMWDVVPVYYGTDRAKGATHTRLSYTMGRGGRLELGRAEITVPKAHQVPSIERPWAVTLPFTTIALYEQAEDPAKHFTIREITSLSHDEFLAVIRSRLAKSVTYRDRAVVFIHGYNTAFDYALFRTAQMAYDLRFDGAAFLYSWPSGSGVAGYVYDRDSAEQAEPFLRQFLELVIKESGAKNVSLIAHSMGNLPLLRVLREIEPQLPKGVKLDQIIMAAPDVDRNLFEQLTHKITRVGRGVTLYASRNDRAMSAARLVAGGIPRAGDVPAEGPIVLDGIDTIDVSSTSTDALMLNHSVYAERNALINDIALLLQSGERPPDVRIPILTRVPTAKGDYWRYP
jgi:esterase/lipase superfamily enzyme